MVDNAPITPGVGLDVATMDQGGVHHQKVLMESLNDAGAPALVSSSAPMPTSNKASNLGGATPFHSRSLGDTAADIGIAPVRLFSFDAFNRSSVDIFIKFYNEVASSVNATNDVPFLGPFLVPAGGGIERLFVEGIQFSVRASVRAVTGLLNTDIVSPAADELIFNAEYK